ncbi:hypothetical protein BS17DRAFT_856294 [Gyrodon lividus]|nr:hypothetical protein BS17DRAFT_856294 [Gyrodon lividus]
MARKVPDNWEKVCEKAVLQIAYVIYTQGSSLTWTKCGANQVTTISKDKMGFYNSGFSLLLWEVASIAADLSSLTTKSCPQSTVPCYDECINHGFLFECTKTDTYWSTQVTMESLINNIIDVLGLPPSQKVIWQIDIWSIHCSQQFWAWVKFWMKELPPTIVLQFVPGGCTSILQPCDVGIQYHNDDNSPD